MPTSGEQLRLARVAAGLTQSELAARAGTSQPAVNRYERGRTIPTSTTMERLFQACVPGRRPSDLLAQHRQEVMDFAHRHGASTVLVFGSVARGDDDAGSDVDLLMDLPMEYSLFDLARMRAELSDLLGVEVDLGTPGALRPRIRDEVLAEARPL